MKIPTSTLLGSVGKAIILTPRMSGHLPSNKPLIVPIAEALKSGLCAWQRIIWGLAASLMFLAMSTGLADAADGVFQPLAFSVVGESTQKAVSPLDTDPSVIVAVTNTALDQLVVRFSEPVDASLSGDAAFQYLVMNDVGEEFFFISMQFQDGNREAVLKLVAPLKVHWLGSSL